MLTLLVAADPISKAYEQIIATGIVGAICLILGYSLYKLYLTKECQLQKIDEAYHLCCEKFRIENFELHKAYHNELKDITEQLMQLLKEKSYSEAKLADVLEQVVKMQSEVERTLHNLMIKPKIVEFVNGK